MVKVGIVGLGFMASTHLKAYRQVPRAQIAALCNPSGRHLDGKFINVTGNIGDSNPVIVDMARTKAYQKYADLLADPEVEVVDICAPTQVHPELAIAALEARKHVLCEKPLARTSADACRIAQAAKTAKTFFMPAMCVRFWPEWAWLKEAIVSQRYGKVLGARFRRVAEPPGWGHNHFHNGLLSGGALLDLHIHDVDFAQYCFGRPQSLFAAGYTKFSGAIDHVVAQYQYASGAIVHAEGSWAMTPGFGFNMSYTANFERATVDYDLARGADALRVFAEGKPAETISCAGPDGYAREIEHLCDAIEANRPPSVVTVDDAVSAVEICEAEETSIKRQSVVSLS